MNRDKAIIDQFKAGLSQPKIGLIHGLSHQRIQQILDMNGIRKTDGGSYLTAIIRKVENNTVSYLNNEKRVRKNYGCSYWFYKHIRKTYGSKKDTKSMLSKYTQHKNNSMNRGIAWRINLYEWCAIWEKSGKWSQRGRNHGEYVMARLDDEGGYEIGNIEIVLNTENIIEYYMREWGGDYSETIRLARKFAEYKSNR